MKISRYVKHLMGRGKLTVPVVGGLLMLAPLGAALADPVTVNVVDGDGNPIAGGYRWLVEADKTYHVPLTAQGEVALDGSNKPQIDPDWPATLSVGFHRSHMPVVASGDETVSPDLDTTKHHYISVLPDSGYALSGTTIAPGQNSVTVHVNPTPTPTAQIVVRVFADTAPVNNVWDQGELGLENFKVILEDGGGRYGISAGVQSQDAYGNPLCTTYNPDGSVLEMGSGCFSGPDGFVTIPNLDPGKYGVIIAPPGSMEDPDNPGTYVAANWTQTSTIEGTKIIDAWVKANEPGYFAEFGPPGPHTEFGFVPAGKNNPYIDNTVLTGGSSISGTIVNNHQSRPPLTEFYNGAPFAHTTPWVGLNLGAAGAGQMVYAKRANEDGTFSIDDVPPGDYQMVVWDDALDLIFAFHTVRVNGDGSCNALDTCNLGDVPVNQWFSRLEHHVFYDQNENGTRDPGEPPILEQNVNLRWRDGTVYQAAPTDGEGFVPFDQVFPFFSWLVAEVDFARFKATGVTVTVDDGGPIDFNDPYSWEGLLSPQMQGDPLDPDSVFPLAGDTAPYRTEVGTVLTQGFQGFLGQTSVMEWGKAPYGPDENGGISGVVFYSSTRAEDDPEFGGAEPWEPGIPGVTVNLYAKVNGDLVPVASTTTDSWDDSLPSNCQYGSSPAGTDRPFMFRGEPTDCFDGMRNWNQVRPAVFDGGYAFGPDMDCTDQPAECSNFVNAKGYLMPGRYVVEVVPPEGYQIVKSQDKNVDFGDEYTQPQLLPPTCVGAEYVVPAELSLFPGVPANLAGQTLNTCDRKEVALTYGVNAAADFFIFTEVPISGHIIGFILDDVANEFDPLSPQFGEKYAPPFLPVSIRDWTGREISRTVSDEYGRYNALVPSTYSQNLPKPSGISPGMYTACMNAKMKVDGSVDPLHNPKYSQFCYTFQYMPGTTTYLDTPVIPVAAFTGPEQSPLDCALNDQTPRISSVSVPDNGVGGGPYVALDRRAVVGSGQVVITAMGDVNVPNPAYDGVGGVNPKTVIRHYGFGDAIGQVSMGDVPLQIDSWSDGVILATIPTNAQGRPIDGNGNALNVTRGWSGQLTVTRGDNGNATVSGVTMQIGLRSGAEVIAVAGPSPVTSLSGSIQAAIDAADANDLILVPPGTYNEMVVMWKPVQLQGWGEGSTVIDAIKQPAEKLQSWRDRVQGLVESQVVSLLPSQDGGFGGIEPGTLFNEEGAGVLVLASRTGTSRFALSRNRDSRIDGFTVTGADTGGGIVVNGYAGYLEVSNNRVINNTGFFAGGIRSGHPILQEEVGNVIRFVDASNDYLRVHNNQVVENGGISDVGGGILMAKGSDGYQVTGNFVCGNFSGGEGAGIAHYGDSDDGLIADNTIIFNENFNQGLTVNGGGVLVSGQPAQGCVAGDAVCLDDPTRSLSEGSGSVSILRNLIKGNAAGAGDGGGIRLSRINGQDLFSGRRIARDSDWNHIDISNNMIVNNVAGLAGAGISLQDALRASIVNNTIANNDNASVAGEAFTPGMPSQSNAQPGAGVAVRTHSLALNHHLPAGEETFSNPLMSDNIVWQNRKFSWMTEPDGSASGLCPDIGGAVLPSCGSTTPEYDDLAVLGSAGSLVCNNCLMTGDPDPLFLAEYVNGNRDATVTGPEVTTAIQAPPAMDEGGNFIRLRFGPLTQTESDGTTLRGDYHLGSGSPAVDAATFAVGDDIDGDLRPVGVSNDIGADERL